MKWAILGLVLFTVVAVLSMYFSQPVKERVPTDLDAAQTCRQLVSDRLASPTGAKFSEGADRQVTKSPADGSFTVTGYVDVQNAGATQRTSYTCKVEYSGGERWRLISLEGL